VKDIAAGGSNVCVIRTDGSVVCWGRNESKQSGAFTGDTCTAGPCVLHPTVVAAPGMSKVVEVSVGHWHTCAVDDAKHVYCWGAGDRGQLGATLSNSDCNSGGAFPCSGVPLRVTALDGADHVAAAGGTTCGVVAGKVYCFGRNEDQQWGWNSGTTEGPGPVNAVKVDANTDLTGVRAIALRRYYACAVTGAGDVYCWGTSSSGALGSAGATNPYAAKVVFP
jgi:alpha-tubulin suppressor-like RCC1 family protein